MCKRRLANPGSVIPSLAAGGDALDELARLYAAALTRKGVEPSAAERRWSTAPVKRSRREGDDEDLASAKSAIQSPDIKRSKRVTCV